MKTLGPFRQAFLGMAMLLPLALLPTPGYADSIDFRVGIALGNAVSVSVTEGDSLGLTLNITNDSGVPITPLFVTNTIFPPTQPDTSDFADAVIFASGALNKDTCGLFVGNPRILANGATCSFDFAVVSDVNMGEVDFDSGVSLSQIGLGYRTAGGVDGFTIENITITVNDSAKVPEPASAMLFGSAIATACLLFRRRRRPQH